MKPSTNQINTIPEHDIDCKYTINEEVIINYGLYKNNKAIIKGVTQYEDKIYYKVQLKVLQGTYTKAIELEFAEDKLSKERKFKIPFIRR